VHSLAIKFFNDLPEKQKLKPEDCAAALQEDLRKVTDPLANDPPWQLYLKIQQMKMKLYGKERASDFAYQMSPDKLSFLGDVALHQHAGSYAAVLPWELVEHSSAWKIDRNVKISDLVAARLPDYLWVEWPPHSAHSKNEPWITRTVGMLVSRLVLLDAPLDHLRALAEQPLGNEGYMIELVRALVQNICDGLPCLGYRLTIVQEDDTGYRFINSLFGNECQSTVIDMLDLHKEVSERDQCKFKKTEQAWTNAAVRILLLAACREWFSDGQKHILLDSELLAGLKAKHNAFFCRMEGDKRHISLRPEYHDLFCPFSTENQ
jgi:hypothetical protein